MCVQPFIIPIVGVIYDCFAARSTADIYINTRSNYHQRTIQRPHVGRERGLRREPSLSPMLRRICTLWMVCSTCTIIELTHLSTSISAGLLSLSLLRLYMLRESPRGHYLAGRSLALHRPCRQGQ
jgi:hypothetical protein